MNNKTYIKFLEEGTVILKAKIHLLGIGKYSFQTSLFGEKPYENNINMPMFNTLEEAEKWIEENKDWYIEYLTENEMEEYLTKLEYDIMDRSVPDDITVDSTKVIDYASDIGYISVFNDDGTLGFTPYNVEVLHG